jgi:molybdopterin synthase catalytic subunit
MDISKTIAAIKKEPGFSEHVGMILVHNGVVRAWSRKDRSPVSSVEVSADEQRIRALREEYEKKPGIFKVLIEYKTGRLQPGDDLLFIVVAGDIRENVKPVLAELLDRVKSEAVFKSEFSSRVLA